jgi:hypothetical protein
MRLSKKLAVVALGTVGAVGAATAAYAFWTTNGQGTGSVATGTLQSLVVNQTSTISGLYPGGPAQPLAGNFNNPNPGKAYISSVTATLAGVAPAAADTAKPACAVGDFDLAGTAPVNGEINPGDGQGAWSGLTIALKNTGANQDNCKNVTLNIAYTANP